MTGVARVSTGARRTGFGRTRPGLCDQEFRRTAMIPAKQSSRNEVNRAWTLISPLPRYRGDWASPPMTLAIAGTARLLVIETRNPQIASPKTTAITIPPTHFLESAELDSGEDMFQNSSHGLASISDCDTSDNDGGKEDTKRRSSIRAHTNCRKLRLHTTAPDRGCEHERLFAPVPHSRKELWV